MRQGERPSTVAILGGGIAGMATACRMADHGWKVTLIERRPYLGGRAFSFADPETGTLVDNGQHVFLGCCTAYIAFLRQLGTLDQTTLQRRLRVPVLAAGGRRAILEASPLLPTPAHLLRAFARYPHLTPKERVSAIRLLARMRFARRDRPAFERTTFYDWLRAHGQSDDSVRRFWDVVIVPTCNDSSRVVSAAAGLTVFQEGVLAGRNSANIGYARTGLSSVMGDAASAYLRARGAEVRLGATVRQVSVEEGRVTGVKLAGGEAVRADAVVSALPWDDLLPVLPGAVASDTFFARAGSLTWSPIVNVHLWYDRTVMADPFSAVVDSPLQWVFNRTAMSGESTATEAVPGAAQYIVISLSGAWEHFDVPKERLPDAFTAEMARVFPEARSARVIHSLVTRWAKSTFRPSPGTAALRPPTTTPVRGLGLAGDWTDTGWPATMEGAVRSGWRAAAALEATTHGA